MALMAKSIQALWRKVTVGYWPEPKSPKPCTLVALLDGYKRMAYKKKSRTAQADVKTAAEIRQNCRRDATLSEYTELGGVGVVT